MYLRAWLWTNWSRDFTIAEDGVDAPDSYTRRIRVDLDRLDLVVDEASGARAFVGTRLRNVAEFDLRLKDRQWWISGTSLPEALARADEKRSAIVTHSETALVHAAHAQLVQVPAVQMALSPLRNILIRLDADGRLSIKDLKRSRKSPDQIGKYIEVLKGVDYLRVEGGDLVTGPAFPSGTRDELAVDTFDRMLARVITQELSYLRFVLGFSQIVGYLRWANSLYLTAWLAERQQLSMSSRELENRYGRYYGGLHRSGIEITGQIQRVIDAGVISRRGDLVTGNGEITPRYFEEASRSVPALS